MLVFDAGRAYGIAAYAGTSRSKVFTAGEKGYTLFAKPLKAGKASSAPTAKKRRGKADGSSPSVWSKAVPVRATAMALAGEVLFLAGAPDVVDPKDPGGAFEGRKGAVVCAYSVADGRKLAELKIDGLPVYDGLMAAGGRLYLAMRNGAVRCFSEEGGKDSKE